MIYAKDWILYPNETGLHPLSLLSHFVTMAQQKMEPILKPVCFGPTSLKLYSPISTEMPTNTETHLILRSVLRLLQVMHHLLRCTYRKSFTMPCWSICFFWVSKWWRRIRNHLLSEFKKQHSKSGTSLSDGHKASYENGRNTLATCYDWDISMTSIQTCIADSCGKVGTPTIHLRREPPPLSSVLFKSMLFRNWTCWFRVDLRYS
jgi:hypothetical protein